ncbi:DEAD/DEAH box helicase [uncultured Ilyobacter sp.]|uniref:DEAD/DEAH box helicase n=1 Tax=uncultured Ilyobacter sp. TaxID=544433 RepID=UPI0029F5B00A|nr:DEAD/DEAH box helicase [uncultured Ilyobacter sp.]
MAKSTNAPDAETETRFADLGLSAELMETLESIGFHTPTDIQRELIPSALDGRDCLGQAKTGTGKTAAFAIPILERVKPGKGVQALVLVPTRELAMQVDEHVRMLGKRHPLKTLLVYGGTRIRGNLDRLKEDKRDIVVGTPGRVLDLIRRRALVLDNLKLAVLDEVDRMLDIGFRDDIRRILREIKGRHQTIFVSATIDDPIRRLARSFMHEPVEINVSSDKLTVDSIEQCFATVDPPQKFATLLGFLRVEEPSLVIVFTRTKRTAHEVSTKLKRAGIRCMGIHGDLNQSRRHRVLKAFRQGEIHVMVATDLASRGLDVMEVSHIVNYDIPEDASVYVHRVGRTARMGQSGYALTFVTRDQGNELTAIEMLINRELTRIPVLEEWLEAGRRDLGASDDGPRATFARSPRREAESGRPAKRDDRPPRTAHAVPAMGVRSRTTEAAPAGEKPAKSDANIAKDTSRPDGDPAESKPVPPAPAASQQERGKAGQHGEDRGPVGSRSQGQTAAEARAERKKEEAGRRTEGRAASGHQEKDRQQGQSLNNKEGQGQNRYVRKADREDNQEDGHKNSQENRRQDNQESRSKGDQEDGGKGRPGNSQKTDGREETLHKGSPPAPNRPSPSLPPNQPAPPAYAPTGGRPADGGECASRHFRSRALRACVCFYSDDGWLAAVAGLTIGGSGPR